MLGASTDEEENGSVEPLDEPVELRRRRGRTERAVTISETVTTMPRGCRHRSRLIEKEISEQARIIQDLKLLGASSATVEQEMRRLQELEALASKDFRRVMLQRLKRQSVKASSIIADHPPTSSTSLASMASGLGPHRPSSRRHTQSQRPPQHSHHHHQRSRSVVVPPILLDYETAPGHGSTDEVLMRDVQQRFLLPPIEGSPPMSCLATQTGDAHRSAGGRNRPRTPAGASASAGRESWRWWRWRRRWRKQQEFQRAQCRPGTGFQSLHQQRQVRAAHARHSQRRSEPADEKGAILLQHRPRLCNGQSQSAQSGTCPQTASPRFAPQRIGVSIAHLGQQHGPNGRRSDHLPHSGTVH